MGKTRKCNKGFSLIELLIAVTILSIVMIMVVQFMSTSSVAYRKTKKNLNVQTEAMTVLEQMSDTIMQARYVRIVAKDQGMYSVEKVNDKRVVTYLSGVDVQYDFVPDNYGNYAKSRDLNANDRDVIIDFDDFRIVDKNNNTYPLDGDSDVDGSVAASTPVRSFRALKSKLATGERYNYIKPEFIYTEHVTTKSSGTDVIVHTIYHITDITNEKDKTCSIYVDRFETNVVGGKYETSGIYLLRDEILTSLSKSSENLPDAAYTTGFTSVVESEATLNSIKAGAGGLLTDKVSDFYLSADTEGNALLTNILFYDDGYEYNTVETINFRNSNVLTVRPQKLYKVKGSGYNVTVPEVPTEASSEEGTTEAAPVTP